MRDCWNPQSTRRFRPLVDRSCTLRFLKKAARLGYGLIHNHPFLDGNKRIGTHAMLVFLDINNITLSYEDDDLIEQFSVSPPVIWATVNCWNG